MPLDGGPMCDGLKDKLELVLKVKFLEAFLLCDFNVHFEVSGNKKATYNFR